VSSAGFVAAAAGCWKVGSLQVGTQVGWAGTAVTATMVVVRKELA
jgi:hypothetical protein